MSGSVRPASDTRGILLMIAAVFFFTLMDVAGKGIAQQTDTVMALWARYVGQTVAVLLVVSPRLRRVLRTRYPWLQLLRSVFLLGATCAFFFGFVLIGLANATAIMNVNPVLITLGAALFLKERFGPRRAIGVIAALIGALIIIRPGSAVFSAAAALPLLAAVMYSAYALTTRFVGKGEDAWTSLLYTAAFGSVVLSLIVPWFWVTPDAGTVALMIVIGLFGAAAHYCLIHALMSAEAGTIAPFAYAGLIFATIWGMVFFGEFPDGATYLGALVIVTAGIYVWHRETKS